MAKKRANGEGSIYKRTDGYWEARVTVGYNERGQQKYKVFGGKTQEIVKKRLREYLGNENAKHPDNACKLTLSAWLDIWYKEYVVNNVRVSTLEDYDGSIRNHLKPNLGHIRLKDLRNVLCCKGCELEHLKNTAVTAFGTNGRKNRQGGMWLQAEHFTVIYVVIDCRAIFLKNLLKKVPKYPRILSY